MYLVNISLPRGDTQRGDNHCPQQPTRAHGIFVRAEIGTRASVVKMAQNTQHSVERGFDLQHILVLMMIVRRTPLSLTVTWLRFNGRGKTSGTGNSRGTGNRRGRLAALGGRRVGSLTLLVVVDASVTGRHGL